MMIEKSSKVIEVAGEGFRPFLILVIVCFLGGIITTAQDILQSDTPTTVAITADEPALLQFDGTTDQWISLIAEPSAIDSDNTIDTTLALIAPDDTQLAYNDDTHLTNSETGEITIQRAAQILNFRLPMDGTYTIRVDSFNGVSDGE